MPSFTKGERLCSIKIIEELIKNGSSFSEFPFRVVYLKTGLSTQHSAQLAISVAKRNFKKAVTRNKIKRRIREAYRKNKLLLYDELQKNKEQYALMLIYIAKTEMEYREIESKLIVTLRKLANSLKR